MYIIPLNGITPLNTMSQNTAVKDTQTAGSFVDIFKNALDNVEQTQKVVEQDNIKATLGEVDNLHEIQINAQKAALALETFVSMKNTAVEAYSEVMRMNI